MAVYVDDGFCGPAGSWGKWTGGGHMQADSTEELMAFAKWLGLKPAWFQKGSRPEAEHFDLTRSKRELAFALGAVSETWREASRRRRPVKDLIEQHARQVCLEQGILEDTIDELLDLAKTRGREARDVREET